MVQIMLSEQQLCGWKHLFDKKPEEKKTDWFKLPKDIVTFYKRDEKISISAYTEHHELQVYELQQQKTTPGFTPVTLSWAQAH